MQYNVTYLSNSGFMVDLEDYLLIFDYQGDCPQIVNRQLIENHFQTIFFVSHIHSDHYSPLIFDFARISGVSYVLSSEIIQPRIFAARMSAGQETNINELTVRSFGSTDMGVSYWISIKGLHFFHAGDLNFWHWKDVSTEFEVLEARRAFDDVLRSIDCPIDVAFFPVDPRMRQDYDEGARIFVEEKAPRIFFPMHFREEIQAPVAFAKWAQIHSQTKVIPLVRSGESFALPSFK